MATDRRLTVFITVCCWVLCILACSPLGRSFPTSQCVQEGLTRAQLRQGFFQPQVIRGELIHRDHPEASLRLPKLPTGSAADRYHDQKARTARRLAAEVQFTTPISPGYQLYGQYQYAMTLYLGTPAQKFNLIVDTGSDLVWLQCKPCAHPGGCYNQTDPLFNPSASSSYSAVPCTNNSTCDSSQFTGGAACNGLGNCHIAYGYGTPGSAIEGVLSTETIAFSNTTVSGAGQLGISNFVFGCMNNNTASFGTFDGLAGFSRRQNSLPSQLSKLTSSNVFSYCLVPYFLSANLTSPLLFGASDSKGLKLVYTSLLSLPGNVLSTFYAVNMTGISVNGAYVNISKAPLEWNSTIGSGGTFFDSGTSYIVLLSDVYTPVVQSLKDFIAYPVFGDLNGLNTVLCYNVSAGVQQIEGPIMSLHFSGVNGGIVDFPLTFENLFISGTDDGTVQCLAISNGGVDGLNIIGNIAQGDHYVETDLEKKRIGWTSRDCSAM